MLKKAIKSLTMAKIQRLRCEPCPPPLPLPEDAVTATLKDGPVKARTLGNTGLLSVS